MSRAWPRIRRPRRAASPRFVLVALILAVALALALAACSGGSPSDGDHDGGGGTTKPSSTPITLTYAQETEFASYNNNTADESSPANWAVVNQVLGSFWNPGPHGEIVPNKDFGSYERISSNPLTIRYTFNPKAEWSDGTPLSCEDAVLAWAANSGRWPRGKRDPFTDQKLTAFSSYQPGAWSSAGVPDCKRGDRSFTVTFATVYADWATLFGPGTILPAHIVEKESGVKDVVAAVAADRTSTMIKLGDMYNSLWVFRPGQYKTDVSPSSGPYQVADWKAGQSITLTANPHWWGTPPRAATLVIRFIPESEQVNALRRGEVQVIDPTPTTELLAQLGEAGSPVTTSVEDSASWEQLDYNLKSEFSSPALRKAFTLCLPRQQIVTNLIKPENPHAQVLQSRFLLPSQDGYSTLAQTGGQNYTAVDVAGARKILTAAKKLGTKVRVGYLSTNPRRKAEVDLIRDFCGQAGFKVVDDGSPTFLSGPANRGDFDVALLAWTWSTTDKVTQDYSFYVTNGVRNIGRYSNPDVNILLKQLYSEINSANQLRILQRLDTTLWSDLATVPLFVYPALLATSPRVEGVTYSAGFTGVTTDADRWSLKN